MPSLPRPQIINDKPPQSKAGPTEDATEAYFAEPHDQGSCVERLDNRDRRVLPGTAHRLPADRRGDPARPWPERVADAPSAPPTTADIRAELAALDARLGSLEGANHLWRIVLALRAFAALGPLIPSTAAQSRQSASNHVLIFNAISLRRSSRKSS